MLGGSQQRGKAAIEAGGVVVEILHAGDLAAWIQAEDLHVTVVKPKDDATLDALVSREWTYVVDLKTMKIVWRGFGSYDGSQPSSVEEGLNQLSNLLGQ